MIKLIKLNIIILQIKFYNFFNKPKYLKKWFGDPIQYYKSNNILRLTNKYISLINDKNVHLSDEGFLYYYDYKNNESFNLKIFNLLCKHNKELKFKNFIVSEELFCATTEFEKSVHDPKSNIKIC